MVGFVFTKSKVPRTFLITTTKVFQSLENVVFHGPSEDYAVWKRKGGRQEGRKLAI